jgi:hypothetical protein
VATPQGDALVCFRDRSADEIRDLRLLRVAGESTADASGTPADRWRIPGCPVNGPALAADGDRVAAAWYAAPADRGRVAVSFSADGGRSFGAPVVLDDAQPVGRLGVQWRTPTESVVSWIGRVGDRGELRLRRVQADGRAGPMLALAPTTAGRTSGIPRLARLTDGRLLALWVDALADPPRLRAARVDPSALGAP